MALAAEQVHIGRQPIHDARGAVFGYELLFRDHGSADAAAANGDQATTAVMLNTFTEFGLETLVGSRLAFINVTRPFLVGELPVPFPPQCAVLEILETISIDDAVLAGARRLVADGYGLALDDFVWDDRQMPLLRLADYVKLDLQSYGPDKLAELVSRLRPYGVRLVAERVETPEHLELARSLGFDYFQGWLLARADVTSTPSLAPGQIATLNLLSRLARPDLDMDEVEDLVRLDVALTYRLLRAANSAASGVRREVASVRDALVMLGLRQLRAWLLLLVVSNASNATEEQLSSALTRAKACELLAAERSGVRPDAAFVVGLLSYLDVLLRQPLTTVIETLPLHKDLRAALVERNGPLGDLLAAVVAYEDGDLARVSALGFDAFDTSRAYLEGVGWSLQTCETVLFA